MTRYVPGVGRCRLPRRTDDLSNLTRWEQVAWLLDGASAQSRELAEEGGWPEDEASVIVSLLRAVRAALHGDAGLHGEGAGWEDDATLEALFAAVTDPCGDRRNRVRVIVSVPGT